MFERILQHKRILTDQLRMKAYRKAVHEEVKKGDVVADIRSGSGLLAFFALQAGARRVYAIEQSDIIEEAKKLAEINGLEKRIVFIKERSEGIELPEKVDVITSPSIGYYGLDEHELKFKIDARNRFLKSGGRLIPSWLELYFVPVESEAVWKDHIGFWSSDTYGFDFLPVRDYAALQRYIMENSGKVNCLGAPSMFSYINLYEIEKVPYAFQGESVIVKNGALHGLVGYFRAGLSQNVVFSTRPEKRLTHWRQTFFPVRDVVRVEKGDKVFCKMLALPRGGGLFWQWETVVYRKGDEIAKFSQSNLSIKKEDFLIRRKNFKPTLTQTGEICQRVLALCDSDRTVGEIADILLSEYPEKYEDIEDALQQVVGIIRGKVRIE